MLFTNQTPYSVPGAPLATALLYVLFTKSKAPSSSLTQSRRLRLTIGVIALEVVMIAVTQSVITEDESRYRERSVSVVSTISVFRFSAFL